MTESKHTPGPWFVHPDGEICSEQTNHNNLNPVVVHHADLTNPADRSLIAAAPELLVAAQFMAESEASVVMRSEAVGGTGARERFAALRAAIAKATGEEA